MWSAEQDTIQHTFCTPSRQAGTTHLIILHEKGTCERGVTLSLPPTLPLASPAADYRSMSLKKTHSPTPLAGCGLRSTISHTHRHGTYTNIYSFLFAPSVSSRLWFAVQSALSSPPFELSNPFPLSVHALRTHSSENVLHEYDPISSHVIYVASTWQVSRNTL